MGYSWAKWAWSRSGQPHLGPVTVLYGLSGHGLDLVNHRWYRIGFIWAKWARVRSGQPHLGPVTVLYGLSGHGLELVSHVRIPYGLFMG